MSCPEWCKYTAEEHAEEVAEGGVVLHWSEELETVDGRATVSMLQGPDGLVLDVAGAEDLTPNEAAELAAHVMALVERARVTPAYAA